MNFNLKDPILKSVQKARDFDAAVTERKTQRFKKPTVPQQYNPPPMPPVKPSAQTNPPNVGSSVQPPKQHCPYETPCGWCSKWDKKCNSQPYKRAYQREMIVFDDGSEAEIQGKF